MSEPNIPQLEKYFKEGDDIQMDYRKWQLGLDVQLSCDFSKLSPEKQAELDSLLQHRLKLQAEAVQHSRNFETFLFTRKNELSGMRDRPGRHSASKPDSGFGSREIPSGVVEFRKSGPLQHEEHSSIKPIPETDVPDGPLATLTSDLKLSEGKREFGTQTEPVAFKDETLPKYLAGDECLAERRRPGDKRQIVPIEATDQEVPPYIQDQYRKFNEYLPRDDVDLLNNQAEHSSRQRNSKDRVN